MKRVIVMFLDNTEQNKVEGYMSFGRICKNNKIRYNKGHYNVRCTRQNLLETLEKYELRLDTHCEDFFALYVNYRWKSKDDKAIINAMNIT